MDFAKNVMKNRKADSAHSEDAATGRNVEEQERHYRAEFSRLTPMVFRLLTDAGKACYGRYRFISRNFNVRSYPRKRVGACHWSLSGPNHPIGHKQWLIVELSHKPQGECGFRVRINNYEAGSTGLFEADLERTLSVCIRCLLRWYESARRHPARMTEGDAVLAQADWDWAEKKPGPHSIKNTRHHPRTEAGLGNFPSGIACFPRPFFARGLL
jgi:hypothetical protein